MDWPLPDRHVTALAGVELVRHAAPLPFETANRAAIDAEWATALAQNPRLFNGPMFLISRIELDGATVRGAMHETDFATFLHWRRNRPVDGLWYCAATAIPVLCDGKLLAIRMASHTVNAGLVYFPAGSFDPDDFIDGRLEPSRCMAREFVEETGIALDESAADPCHVGVMIDTFLILARRYQLPFDGKEAKARILAHQSASGDDEIDDVLILDPADDQRATLSSYMPPLMRWHAQTPMSGDA